MDKLLIAPISEGIKTDLVPFMLPEDAFQEMTNAMIYNGVIRRKPVAVREESSISTLQSRLRIQLGVITGAGTLAGNVPAGIYKVGQQFSIGDVTYTSFQVNGLTYVSVDDGSAAIYNTNTGAYTFAGCTPGATVYYYPCLKVMHIYTPNDNISSIYFDESYSYTFEATGFEYIPNGDSTWNSNNLSLYSSDVYNSGATQLLVVASLNDTDGDLKYYNFSTSTWANYRPKYLSAGGLNVNVITKCGLVKKFGRRLLLFDTYEYDGFNTTNYKNRIRYSEAGDAFNADSWYEYPDSSEKGGTIDLPAEGRITAVEILNNRLIIFCENSIYGLSATGNRLYPFSLYEIDSNIGSSSNSVVEVGDKLIFINANGLYYCDGVRTERISNKIESIFNGDYWFDGSTIFLHENKGLLFITLRSADNANDFLTDTVLLYNYKNDTFSRLTDNYTALGLTNIAKDGSPYSYPAAIMGNQLGYMFNFDFYGNKNGISMHIIYLEKPDANHIDLKIDSHSITPDRTRAIQISNSALAGLNGSYFVTVIDGSTLRIESDGAIAGYSGDAYVTRVDNVNFRTKEFSPYLKNGMGINLSKIALNINKSTNDSRIAVQPSIGADAYDSVTTRYIETEALNTFENSCSRVWRTVNLSVRAETIGITCGYTNATLLDDVYPFENFTVNAMILYTYPSSLI